MNIIQKPSPNFSSRGTSKPEMIVVHCTDGSYPGDLNYLCNPNPGSAVGAVSSHFYVAPDGQVYQLVDMANVAWCNGRVDKPTAKLKKDLLGKYINPNLYTVSIETSLRATEELRPAQEASLKELIRYIASTYNIPLNRDKVIGHREIYSLKTCPGKINIESLLGQEQDKEKIKQQIIDLVNKL